MKWKLVGLMILTFMLAGCASSRYHAAEEELDRKDYDLAIRNYLKLLQPRLRDGKRYALYDKEAWTGIGVAYWHKQNYSAAIKIFEEVLKKDPRHGKAVFFLAMSQEALDMEDEALQTYSRYKSLPDDDPYRYFMFGRLDWLKMQYDRRFVQKSIQSEDLKRFEDFPANSVAVTYFLNLSDNPEWDPLQKGLAELMSRDLACVQNLVVVNRSILNAIMMELGLTPMSLREKDVLQRVAKLLGVRYLISGSYLITDNLKVTMDAEVINAETNSAVTSMNFEENMARVFKMEKELIMRIVDFFGIYITESERKDLLQIPTEDMAAFLKYCRGLDAIDQNNFSIAQDYFNQAMKFDGDFIEARDYMLNPKIWEVTHNYNQMRVTYEVRHMVETTAKGRARLIFTPPPDLVSPYNRLQWMGLQENVQILPGPNARNAFLDASYSSAPIIPYELQGPPAPPELP